MIRLVDSYNSQSKVLTWYSMMFGCITGKGYTIDTRYASLVYTL